MRKILLTFDYEIYFDGGNNYRHLLENTSRILNVAEARQVKLVFFIDVLYLVKLEETGQSDILALIIQQVGEMSSRGHEIQFHYHPHWINAKYEEGSGSWVFDRTDYSFSDTVEKYGLDKASDMLTQAYDKFKEYFSKQSSTFRAGGLSITKCQGELIRLLKVNGFQYDSSVMPGLKQTGKYIINDHSRTTLKNAWGINPRSGFFHLYGDGAPFLMEVPIMTLAKSNISLLRRVLTSLRYRYSRKLSERPQSTTKSTGKPIDLELSESVYPITITFDKSGPADIILLKHYTSEYFRNGNDIMCILSHPKSFREHSFGVFEKYIEWVKALKNHAFVGFNDLN